MPTLPCTSEQGARGSVRLLQAADRIRGIWAHLVVFIAEALRFAANDMSFEWRNLRMESIYGV